MCVMRANTTDIGMWFKNYSVSMPSVINAIEFSVNNFVFLSSTIECISTNSFNIFCMLLDNNIDAGVEDDSIVANLVASMITCLERHA